MTPLPAKFSETTSRPLLSGDPQNTSLGFSFDIRDTDARVRLIRATRTNIGKFLLAIKKIHIEGVTGFDLDEWPKDLPLGRPCIFYSNDPELKVSVISS